jgi:hypothetical protein
MKGWLDKYQGGGPIDPFGLGVAKKDAVVIPKALSSEELKRIEANRKAKFDEEVAKRKTYINPSSKTSTAPAMRQAAEDRIAQEKANAFTKKIAEGAQTIGGALELAAPFTGPFMPIVGGVGAGLGIGSSAYLAGKDAMAGNYGSAALNAGFGALDLAGFAALRNPAVKDFVQGADHVSDYSQVVDLTGIPENIKKAVPQPWQMQELPGLHLKSTMVDGPVSKIVEPKTGLVNVEQALGIIGKESGGAEKLALIKQGLGENLPKKMDYNEFRKTVQDQLIPLERQFATHASNYGLPRIGYTGKTPLENQTLILSNKGKFGRGSSAHDNPEETLGHAHFLRDAESPDVLTVTQIQSDAFQGPYRIIPKATERMTPLEQRQFSFDRLQQSQERNKAVLNKMKTEGVDEAGAPVDNNQIKQFEDIVKQQEQANAMSKADLENFSQKQLLDKSHQERYLQELVDYAGGRGDINKMRVPTPETAAKVQNYIPTKTWNVKPPENGDKVVFNDGTVGEVTDDTFFNSIDVTTKDGKKVRIDMSDSGYGNSKTPPVKSINDIEVKETSAFDPDHQTILKKYAEQPKTIKKLFGEEPKIVTDGKGNTWYEFDIPKKFKEGKGEIKALKNGGWLDKYNDGGPVQPNYNDYSVSAGPGFEGDGYSNVGRNYSPAWGGQFQMGGSIGGATQGIPGATGFMYARTGSIPSNGKYAKKTKASAEDGIQLKGVEETQPVKTPGGKSRQRVKAEEEIINRAPLDIIEEGRSKFRYNMLEDAVKHDMAIEQGVGLDDINEKDLKKKTMELLLKRESKLSNPKVNFVQGDGTAGQPVLGYYDRTDPNNTISLSDNLDKYSIDEFKGTTRHEFRHAYDDGGRNLTNYEKELISRKTNLDNVEKQKKLGNQRYSYLTNPTEVTARLQEIRGGLKDNPRVVDYLRRDPMRPDAYKDGLYKVDNFGYYIDRESKERIPIKRTYDPRKDKATHDDLYYLQKMKGFENTSGLNDLLQIMKTEDIVDLLNTIATNNPQQGMPMAQNGAEMKFYQEGLDFKPKTISRNGSVIKDDMGQWAHPGEITEIDSNQITMQGVPYPVLGISNTGDTQMMYPDEEYEFIGDSVTEIPMMQKGGNVAYIDSVFNANKNLNWVKRLYDVNRKSIKIPGVKDPATHYMQSGDGRLYPTVVEMPDGKLKHLGDKAFDYADSTNTFIEFPTDSIATWFGENYKKGTGVLKKKKQGGQLTKLDQLSNFTNYNTKQPGSWLDKYQ